MESTPATNSADAAPQSEAPELQPVETSVITPTTREEQLDTGLTAVSYTGGYWFDEYLAQGGAASDAQLVEFLARNLSISSSGITPVEGFGCSTIAVSSPEGDTLFGRNFDWQSCDAIVITSTPDNGYASISTVNMSFLSAFGILEQIPAWAKPMVALYAPLDGMNDQGLAVVVNMIQDSAVIEQNTEKPDLTTTTAIRLLLDRAANVEEALALLGQYDMHSSMGMMVHFVLSDRSGRSVVVEYVGNEMIVVETPIVTNFYLSEGPKNGVGTAQSHTRYDILQSRLAETATMTTDHVRDALSSVSKNNFGEFESTEWSIVYNKTTGEARYYHRENFERSYTFRLDK